VALSALMRVPAVIRGPCCPFRIAPTEAKKRRTRAAARCPETVPQRRGEGRPAVRPSGTVGRPCHSARAQWHGRETVPQRVPQRGDRATTRSRQLPREELGAPQVFLQAV
jgi:hypothetical protein